MAVLTARLLWTFAAAYRRYGDAVYLQIAQRAFDYIQRHFVDDVFGGVYWSADRHGRPWRTASTPTPRPSPSTVWPSTTGRWRSPPRSALAQELFGLVEQHSYDRGTAATSSAAAAPGRLEDMRLSAWDVNSRKSMNTLLHLMEAYTNLLAAGPMPHYKPNSAA